METNESVTSGQEGQTGSQTSDIIEEGSEAYTEAEKTASELYNKTTQKLNETYEKTKMYNQENPGTTILVALGIGVAIGLLLANNNYYRPRTNRIARPVINALSDIAAEFFR